MSRQPFALLHGVGGPDPARRVPQRRAIQRGDCALPVASLLSASLLSAVQTSRKAFKLPLRVGGLKSYGGMEQNVLFGSLPNVDKGANLIITVLFFFLWSVKTGTTAAASATTLFLQVDGGSENTN